MSDVHQKYPGWHWCQIQGGPHDGRSLWVPGEMDAFSLWWMAHGRRWWVCYRVVAEPLVSDKRGSPYLGLVYARHWLTRDGGPDTMQPDDDEERAEDWRSPHD